MEEHSTNLHKPIEELLKEVNAALREDIQPMTEQEIIEEDAEDGYFDDLEYYQEDD